MDRFEMAGVADVSRVLGMNSTINQEDYTEKVTERFGMKPSRL